MQSPLLAFSSGAFPVASGEDDRTNPGVYGRALARWLAEGLRTRRGLATAEPIAEDFAWCVPIETAGFQAYVACASSGESTEDWRVLVFVEGGILKRLMGRDRRAELADDVFFAVRDLLAEHPEVRDLRTMD